MDFHSRLWSAHGAHVIMRVRWQRDVCRRLGGRDHQPPRREHRTAYKERTNSIRSASSESESSRVRPRLCSGL